MMAFKLPLPMLQNSGDSNPAGLLSQLPPLVLPSPVSWWPIAIGWWLLSVLILLLGGLALFLIKRHYHSTRLIKISRQKLKGIYQLYRDNQNSSEYLNNCNQLIRSFCLKQYQSNNLTVLSGDHWLEALDDIVNITLLNTAEGQQLLMHYQQHADVDIDKLHNLLVRWFNTVPKQLKPQQIKRSHTHAI